MNFLSLTRKRPASGKTKSADNPMAIWINEWNAKGQLLSMGESRSGSFETQYDEHIVITGMPDTRMLMMISRMKFFRLRFI
jgi:predicted secreted hydrolase